MMMVKMEEEGVEENTCFGLNCTYGFFRPDWVGIIEKTHLRLDKKIKF